MATPAQNPRARVALTWAVLAVLVLWVFSLRWHSFARPMWNLDEAIHATVARTLLDGGVLYRDTIDQRTPLSYYAVAAVFAATGENNMWALHALLAGLVAGTAYALYLIGTRWRGPFTGGAAALVFCALSTNLLYVGDAYSLSTEWFVIFFTTWSAWWFWRNAASLTFGRAALAGAGFGLAFLSKQPALLAIGAPLLTLGYMAMRGFTPMRPTFLAMIGLMSGWLLVTGLTASYFAAHEAWADARFYTWTYNLSYYASVTTLQDQFNAAATIVDKLANHYPVIGLLLVAAIAVAGVEVVQLRPTDAGKARQPWGFYLLTWTALAWSAAAASGRVFDHYYIQLLPPLALLAGWLIGEAWGWLRSPHRLAMRAVATVVLAATTWSVIAGPWRAPWARQREDYYCAPAAAFVRQHTSNDDRIFVWGYLPDFYLLADRKAASRFVYASFVTGLILHTKSEEKQLHGRPVPGALESLLDDLEKSRPEFIIDTSVDPGGYFAHDPLEKYPALAEFVGTNYVRVETGSFEQVGCRLYLLKNSARRSAEEPVTAGVAEGPPDQPDVMGPTIVEPVTSEYVISGSHPAGRLGRLELLVDGAVLESIHFEPTDRLALRANVPFGRLGVGRHELQTRATGTNGTMVAGPVLTVECRADQLSRDKARAFALARTGEPIEPVGLRAEYGGSASRENGRQTFHLHAPSMLTYPILGQAALLRGNFGFRDGAWATGNSSPTDGAEFIIEEVRADGSRELLLKRWLRPTTMPSDRGRQSFEVNVAAGMPGQLVFTINNGPDGNASSDWTYWSDLLLIGTD